MGGDLAGREVGPSDILSHRITCRSVSDNVPHVLDDCRLLLLDFGPSGTRPSDAIADPDEMDIKLWVNDELKQNSNSSQMIFKFNEQIAYLSSRVTLNPGDIIATGTPAGCGMFRGVFLKPGDQIRIVVRGLGELCNPVVAG